MRYLAKALLIKRFLLLCILGMPLHLYAETELTVGWESWEPFQFQNESNQLTGLDIELIQAIAKDAEIKLKFKDLPWKRHLKLVKSGKIDLAMGASKSAEREEFAFFTNAYRTESVVLYVRNGEAEKIKLPSLAALIDSKYQIGVELGYYYGKEFEQLIKNKKFKSHITNSKDLSNSSKMVLKKRLDGVLADPIAATAYFRRTKLTDQFEKHSMPVYSDDIYIMVSKKHPNAQTIVQQINRSISTLKSDGTFKEIFKKWLD